MNPLLRRLFVILAILIGISSTILIGYAYWDQFVDTQDETLTLGEWGTPITTAQEFYNFATKSTSLATDRYFLFNDIDFTGFTWAYNATNNAVTFRGTLDGNGKTLSNLTITNNSSTYLYFGIFPRMQGGSVYNLTLSNVNLSLGSTALGGTSLRAGLIAGNVYGLTNTIQDITILNCGVRGTSTTGTGGLIGNITTATTVVHISDIKATGLKVFSKSSSSGGLIGYIGTSGATVTVADVDLQGEVHAYATSSYTGGIVGYVISGGKISINRVVLETTNRNTLETNATYFNRYSQRYLGGIVGYSLSASANILITDAFYTGNLFTQATTRRGDIGTATGRASATSTRPTLTRTYYSNVQFSSSTGTIIYTPDVTPTGQMSTLVTAAAMPTVTWWNGFFVTFASANALWAQDPVTGRPYLIR